MEVNIKTYYVICEVLYNFNLEGHGTSGLYLKQSLKVTILKLAFIIKIKLKKKYNYKKYIVIKNI